MKIAFLMDDIFSINPTKDTSFCLALGAQKLAWELYYINSKNLFWHKQPKAIAHSLKVQDTKENFCQLSNEHLAPLSDFDLLLLRSDPPFDTEYLYRCQLLELLENKPFVINNPKSVLLYNEKLFALQFPQYTPQTLVSNNTTEIKQFLLQQQKIVLKPLDSMGGQSIFFLQQKDLNATSIIETITQQGKKTIMAQQYIDEVKNGDKRILIINGIPVKYGLLRTAPKDDFRSNLAVGGKGSVFELSDVEQNIAKEIGKFCLKKGLLFVGLDMIGNYITEINITSPTGLREIANASPEPLVEQLLKSFTH